MFYFIMAYPADVKQLIDGGDRVVRCASCPEWRKTIPYRGSLSFRAQFVILSASEESWW